jgi:hypothetical protein
LLGRRTALTRQWGVAMDSIRKNIWTGIALATVLAIGAPLTAGAQNAGGEREPYTPAKDAKDLRAVLFNWMWHQGMLKGEDERDMVASLEYQGKGTIQVDGQPCTLTKYRASTYYPDSTQRIQYSCTRANGQTYSNIEVVSGLYAWDEDVPGATIGPQKGTVKPMPNAVLERQIRIWASPQGAPKAALAGATETFWLGPNPGLVLEDGATKVRNTSLAWEGGKPVLTFPLPGVAGATATATLDARYMTEKVVVKQGSTTTEFTYGDYQDWNNPLNKIEVFYAGKMTERRNGAAVRDLTTTETETGNVYVVAPIPAAVKSAMKPAGQLPKGVVAKNHPNADKAAPTPRIAGKPDMTGNWTFTDWIGRYGRRRCGPTQDDNCSRQVNQTEDFELYSPSRYGSFGRPIYKPEHWDKVQQLDMWTNKEDPVMTCQPLGVPRQGAPRRIIQTEKDIVFFYGRYADAGGGFGEYRIIPTDGRKRTPESEYDSTYMGVTVGNWEGDTLVLDSVAFTDLTWLGRGGFFHSADMHVVERFTRQGNTILYEVTVEDPQVLVEPWKLEPRTMVLNPNPDAGLLPERGNCEVYEDVAETNQIRH